MNLALGSSKSSRRTGTNVDTDDRFEFDPVRHLYLLNGKRLPSVTGIMKAGGLTKDYSDVDPKVLANAAARGTAVHKAIEQLHEGTLDWAVLHDEIIPRVLAYEKFRTDARWQHLHSEQMFYSKRWMYAGTMDAIGTTYGTSNLVLLDYKTSYESDLPAWKIQIQAYKQLWDEHHEEKIEHCAILWLKPDGNYEYFNADDEGSWLMFLYALKIAEWKKTNKR